MTKKKVSLKMRNEEYAVAGRFLEPSFKRDRKKLEQLSNEFDEQYEDGFVTQIDRVEEMEQGLGLTQDQKDATASLYQKTDEMDKEMNSLSFRFGKVGLDVKPITKVKKQLHNGNVEGACKGIESLVQLADDRSADLVAKGMNKDYPLELKAKNKKLRELNGMQNVLMNQGKGVTFNEKTEYEALFAYIQNICRAGKIVFDGTITEDEYTITRLIKRMRAPKSEEKEEKFKSLKV